MKIKKVQAICLVLTCIAATGLIGCGKTDEMSEEHEAITFMAPYLEVDSFIEEVHKTYPAQVEMLCSMLLLNLTLSSWMNWRSNLI